MKPQLIKMSSDNLQSFSVRQDKVPHFFKNLHYHSEVEFVLIDKGSGTHFIGDSISRFSEGDLYLIGSNLPHCWRCDDIYFENKPDLVAEAKVVHFLENYWGIQFLDLPENKAIRDLLIKAKSGIKVIGKTKFAISKILDKLLTAKSTERIILILQALSLIAHSKDLIILSSPGFTNNNYIVSEAERINDIFNYTMSNFHRKITLEEIADVANISPNSFCRYFKNITKKTYSQFLMEIRIGHACKLLIESTKNVNYVCYESGFNNFSNFNKYFKAITGKSPLSYKKSFVF